LQKGITLLNSIIFEVMPNVNIVMLTISSLCGNT